MSVWDDYLKTITSSSTNFGTSIKETNYGDTMSTVSSSTLPRASTSVSTPTVSTLPSLSTTPTLSKATTANLTSTKTTTPTVTSLPSLTSTPTLTKASDLVTTPKTTTTTPTTTSNLSFMDRIGVANEKMSRLYAQNAADMATPKKTSITLPTLASINSANTNASNIYAATAADMYAPTATTVRPTQYATAATLSPLKTATETTETKKLTPEERWLATAGEGEFTPAEMRSGSSILDRIYNAGASISDSTIGSIESLKEVAKQSTANESEYRDLLNEFDDTITNLIVERNKYATTSDEYKEINEIIDNLYNGIDSVRDKSADLTEANKYMENASALRDQAETGMSDAAKLATDAAISVGQNLVTMALTGGVPAATLALMGAQAAGSRANELTNSGASASEALGRGVVSGAIEAITEKIPLDNLVDIIKVGGKSALVNVLKQMGTEGAEEIASYIMNYAADKMAQDENAEFSVQEMLESGLSGALAGGIMGGGATLIGNYVPGLRTQTTEELPRISPEYTPQSTDLSNSSVNIGNQTAEQYLNDVETQQLQEQTLPTAVQTDTQSPVKRNAKTRVRSQRNPRVQYRTIMPNTQTNTQTMPTAMQNTAQNTMPTAQNIQTMPMAVANTTSSNNIADVPSLRTADASEISEYVNNSLNNKAQNAFMKIGAVSEKLKSALAQIGLDAKNYVHALRDNDIRHIDKSHGSQSNDKYKVTESDYSLLEDIFNNYDELYEGYQTSNGNRTIAYEKTYDNKTYVVEEVYENGVLSVKQIIKTGINSKPSFLKKMQKISSKTNANVADSMTRSTDYTNSPPGEHVQDVNLATTDSVTDYAINVNGNTAQELQTQTMPRAVETVQPAETIAETMPRAINTETTPTAETIAEAVNTDVAPTVEAEVAEGGSVADLVDTTALTEAIEELEAEGIDISEEEIANAMTDMAEGTTNRTMAMAMEGTASTSIKVYTKAEQALIDKYERKIDRINAKNEKNVAKIEAKSEKKTARLEEKNAKLKDKNEQLTADYKAKRAEDKLKAATKLADTKAKDAAKLAETKAKDAAKLAETKAKDAASKEQALAKQQERNDKVIAKKDATIAKKDATIEKFKLENVGDEVFKLAKKIDNETKYMPPEMQAKVSQALQDIDTKSKNISGKSISQINEINEYIEKMKAEDPDFEVPEALQQRIDQFDKTKYIGDLSLSEMYELRTTLNGLEHEFTNYKKMLGQNQRAFVKDVATEAKAETSKHKKVKSGFLNTIFNVEALNAKTVFKRLGNYVKDGAWATISGEFTDGQRKGKLFEKKAMQQFNDVFGNKAFTKEIQKLTGKNAEWITYTTENGDTIEFTKGQRCAIYMHAQNANNNATMQHGGITLVNKEAYLAGNAAEMYRGQTPVRLTQNDINNIISQMTEAELAICRGTQSMYKYITENVNEVSMQKDGYEKATVENYFPKAIDKNTIKTTFSLDSKNGTASDPGFLEERTGNTGAAMKLVDITDVALTSIADASKYISFAIPMRDFSMVYNSYGDGKRSVKGTIDDVFGANMTRYLNDFVDYINNNNSSIYFVDSAAGKLMSNYAKATLSFNPKVSLQQVASVVTASSEVGITNIAKGAFIFGDLKKQIISEIDNRSGYRWDRAFKNFDRQQLDATSSSKNRFGTNNMLKTAADNLNPMNWIRRMDLWATDWIARAAYCNVESSGQYEVGSDEFWDAVVDNYETALENTQPMYTPMEKTGIARSNSKIAKAFNMFATQRNQNYNMMYEAFGELSASKGKDAATQKAARENFTSTMGAIVTSNAIVALITTLAQAVTDNSKFADDDGEITVESVAKYYGATMTESFAGNFIGINQIYSGLQQVLKGSYSSGVEEPTLSLINDVFDSTIDLGSGLADFISGAVEAQEQGQLANYIEDNQTTMLKKIRSAVTTFSKAAGIPVANAEKYITGIVGIVAPDLKAAYTSTYTELSNSTISGKIEGGDRDAYLAMAIKDRVSDSVSDKTIESLTKLYNNTEDTSVLPRYSAPTSISYKDSDGETIKKELTYAEQNKYLKTYSQVLSNELNSLVGSSYYKSMSDKDKLETLEDLYSYAEDEAESVLTTGKRTGEDYIAETADYSDNHKELATSLKNTYGLSYGDFDDIYEAYADIKSDKTASDALKATQFDDYLLEHGYTSEYEITDALKNGLTYGSSSSYNDNEKYQTVKNYVDVETFDSMKAYTSELESGVDYAAGVSGAKSLAIKALVDEYIEEHGLTYSSSELRTLYIALGVGKTYAY